MKKFVALSALLAAASGSILVADVTFAQTISILSGQLALTVDSQIGPTSAAPTNLNPTTVLTPLGAISITGFNGTIVNNTNPSTLTVNSSVVLAGTDYTIGDTISFQGTTDGTVGFRNNAAFTIAPTVINANFDPQEFTGPGSVNISVTITGGSITLPEPPPVVVVTPVVVSKVETCTDCFTVSPDLRISNSTFLSPASQQPEYSQEYSRNNFSTSSFDGGRVLGLENK
jgi:hypothetical protein